MQLPKNKQEFDKYAVIGQKGLIKKDVSAEEAKIYMEQNEGSKFKLIHMNEFEEDKIDIYVEKLEK